jgi:hypothetical protein
MDRSFFEDEHLIVFITIYFFLVFNFEFYFLQRYCKKVAPLCEIGATLLQCAIGCWQPFGNKFVTGSKRVLATLWQICNWASEVVGNPLTHFPKGYWQLLQKVHIYHRVANTLLALARGYCLPSRAIVRGFWISSKDTCKRVAQLTKKEATFLKYL